MQVQLVTPATAGPSAAPSSFDSPVDVATSDTPEASKGFGSPVATDTAAAAVANTSSLAAAGGSEGGEGAVTGSQQAALHANCAGRATADATGVVCYLLVPHTLTLFPAYTAVPRCCSYSTIAA